MIIFLDIDGVLRRRTAPSGKFEPACLECFQAVVREVEDARIVISSDWRLTVSLDEIREEFFPDIAARLVGETPYLPGTGPLIRYREVLEYVWALPTHVPWVAVDDVLSNYPREALDLVLVLTDADAGFDAGAAARLRRLLSVSHEEPGLRARRRLLETGGRRR